MAKLVALGTDRDFARARKGFGSFFAKDVERASVQSAYEEVCAALQEFAARADADLAPVLQKELLETVAAYEELNAAAVQVARVYRFSPAQAGGEPVAVWVSHAIDFRVE